MMAQFPSIPFACPQCHLLLEQTAPDEMSCPVEGHRFPRLNNIWRMLLPGRADDFSQFMREYETIRRLEGRGHETPAYYRSLPSCNLNGRMKADWRIRGASFDALLKHIVQPMEQSVGHPLRVLDLGAGNGWLSNRLALRGHIVTAVDLLTNDLDGLGCYRHYDSYFTLAQAEFDRLPLPDHAADLVIFNASLHYSVDYTGTLCESKRVLDPNGKMVVMDTPIYHDLTSGVQMVAERENQFVKQFGFPSNALPSKNYLTYQSLAELSDSLDLRWQTITPYYGIRWLLRPMLARLLGRREPAKFHLIVLNK